MGFCLRQLSGFLTSYDNDTAAIASIDEAIRFIENEDFKRGIGINFVGLDRYRSICSSYGPSFSQTYRLLLMKFEILMEAIGEIFQNAAYTFIKDPSSLRENRLAHFFI